MIAANPNWLMGGIIYVEAHGFSVALQAWVDMMVTPMPDEDAALIEFDFHFQMDRLGEDSF